MVALTVWSDSCAGDIDEAEQLFADHCAVCHGADRGGYIGPALNRDETMLTEFEIYAKITTGKRKKTSIFAPGT
jgi:mono/diheme cytochrome c family protein